LWKGPTRCSPAYDLKFSSTISLITSREPSAEGTTAISSSTDMAAASLTELVQRLLTPALPASAPASSEQRVQSGVRVLQRDDVIPGTHAGYERMHRVLIAATIIASSRLQPTPRHCISVSDVLDFLHCNH